MNLTSMLVPDAVAFEPAILTQKQAFDRIAERLAPAIGVPPARIAAALAERERLGTTGFGGGTAIPHGRVAGTGGIRAAVVRFAQPVDWSAVDGLPVDLAVALVGPEDGGAEHLKALALVSRTLRDQAIVAKLRGADSADALWALLAGTGRRAA